MGLHTTPSAPVATRKGSVSSVLGDILPSLLCARDSDSIFCMGDVLPARLPPWPRPKTALLVCSMLLPCARSATALAARADIAPLSSDGAPLALGLGALGLALALLLSGAGDLRAECSCRGWLDLLESCVMAERARAMAADTRLAKGKMSA